MNIGDTLPDITLVTTGNRTINLTSLKGYNVVLYFYPKDDTPGCTQEGKDFRDKYADFTALKTMIFGVSRDDLASHEQFKTAHCFPFDLLVDDQAQLCHCFDVVKLKNSYGKQVSGIERSTFLFDSQGVLRCEWRKVKVDGHVQAVLEAIQTL